MATQIAITDVDTTNDTTDDTPEPTGEVRPDMPAPEYYQLDRPGSTAVESAASATPAEYAHWRESDRDASEAQQLGQLVHEAVLEPEKWSERPPPPPRDPSDMYSKSAEAAALEADGMTIEEVADSLGYSTSTVEGYRDKDGYDEMVDYYRDHDADQAVGESTRVSVETCRDRIYDVDEARELLEGAQTEVSALAEVDGVPCRARFDIMADDPMRPGDLKTTRRSNRHSASRDDWGYVVGDKGYHAQAGLYLMILAEASGMSIDEAIDDLGWWWIAVETDAPHLAAVHRASRGTLEAGIEAARDGLETIRKYRDGDRSGYSQQGMSVTVPEYLL
jgi:hypothetical protein